MQGKLRLKQALNLRFQSFMLRANIVTKIVQSIKKRKFDQGSSEDQYCKKIGHIKKAPNRELLLNRVFQ